MIICFIFLFSSRVLVWLISVMHFSICAYTLTCPSFPYTEISSRWLDNQSPSRTSQGYNNVGYHPETHLEHESRTLAFVYNVHGICPILLTICAEHDTVTSLLSVLFAKRLGNWKITYWQTRFWRFELEESLRGIFYMTTLYCSISCERTRSICTKL